MVRLIKTEGCTMPYLTKSMFESYLRGEFSLDWCGSPMLRPMTPAQREAFDRAIKDGYIIKTSKNKNAIGAFYYWCEINARPNIEIRPYTKYAQVRTDFISIAGSPGFSDKAQSILEEQIYKKLNAALKPGSMIGLGGVYTYFTIRKNLAEAAAALVWKIAIDDLREQYGDIDDAEALKTKIHAEKMARWKK